MKPKVISDHRRSPKDVEMTTVDNRKIFVSPNATIADMIREGVSDFGVSPKGDPKIPNYYYSHD